MTQCDCDSRGMDSAPLSLPLLHNLRIPSWMAWQWPPAFFLENMSPQASRCRELLLSVQEALIKSPDTIKAYYDGYMNNASSSKAAAASKDPASRSCQIPPTEGLKFIRGGPSQVQSPCASNSASLFAEHLVSKNL